MSIIPRANRLSMSPTRRRVLHLLTGGAAAFAIFGSRRAYAQYASEIANNLSNAADLLRETVSADTPLSERDALYIAERELHLRHELTKILSELDEDEEYRFVRAEHADIALMITVDSTIDIVPSLDDITTIEVQAYGDCDPVRATVYIILDAAGFGFDHRSALIELIRNTPIQALVEELADGYQDRTWEDTAKLIIDLILVVAGAEFLGRVYRATDVMLPNGR